jgi:hypothetical protein
VTTEEEDAADATETPEKSRPLLRDGWRVLAFAGGAEFPRNFDDLVLESVEASPSPAEAALRIAVKLEAAPSTNAGLGSALRLDGTTIECDALVMDSKGRRALVGGLRSASSPVSVAAALYRAGGVTVRGAAADDLAERLGAGDVSLLTQSAETAYLSDLRLHAGSGEGRGPGSIESLYVSPEKLSQALASPSPERENKLARTPVFVVVTDGTTSAVAASSGGIVLSHPGAPSLLDAPHNAVALNEEGVVFVLATHSACPDGALQSSQQLRATRSSLSAVQYLSASCPDAPYVVLSGKTLRTNFPADMLYARGEGLEGVEPRPAVQNPSPRPAQNSLDVSVPTAKLATPSPAVLSAPRSTKSPGLPSQVDETRSAK